MPAGAATGQDDRAVAKLQALVRIPTVSNRDPALADTGRRQGQRRRDAKAPGH